MRSHNDRRETAFSSIPTDASSERGFSMVELLITVVLAGIIFAAMVPVFASALKETSRDNFRVTATNIAQDRIEKIRMLGFVDITADNLNSSSFANNQFGTSFTTISGKQYTIENYFVVDAEKYKTIKVKVSWGSAPRDSTTVQTVVMDPAPVTYGSTPTPTATPSPHSTTGTNYTLMVSVTDDDVDKTYGVRVTRIDVTPNTVPPPTMQVPTVTNALTVSWTGLIGGPDVIYRVTIKFKPPGYSTMTLTRDVTLLDSTSVYFDTNPYQ
jgi:prepilin-type N-terminal cleavage/methylation domain-containing protein